MSATGKELRSLDRDAMIVDCATRMAALFRRLPMLIGFTMQDSARLTAERVIAQLDDELSLADVCVHDWPGLEARPELYAEIAATVLDILEDHPGARHVLRGFSWARAFH